MDSASGACMDPFILLTLSFLLGSPLEQAREMWSTHNQPHRSSPQTLVYVAIGSCSPSLKPAHQHQECPLWLQRFRASYPYHPIRIILIDPDYEIHDTRMPEHMRFTLVQKGPFGRVYAGEGEGDVEVLVVPQSIDMDVDAQSPFNIIALAQQLSRMCAEEPGMFMVVIDAFTGHNPYMYRNLIPNAPSTTFLIGSEESTDSGCFRDFSQPGTGPLIVPDNDGRFMFLTPANVDNTMLEKVMHITPTTSPSSSPPSTFVQLSLRRWIEGVCRKWRAIIDGELLLLLRMFAKIDRQIEIADSIDNIERSLERCKEHGIEAQGPQDVYYHMRRLIALIAQKYAKNMQEFEVEIDTLIATLASEPDIHKYGLYVNAFFNKHFPQYPFA
jgi:hypothetical protein